MDLTLEEIKTLLTRPDVIWAFVIVFMSLLSSYLMRKLFVHIERQAEKTNNLWDDAFVKAARKPASWIIWVLGISWAAEIVARGTGSALAQMIDPVRFVSVVGILAYFLSRFVSEAEKASIQGGADITTAQAIGK
ncbi:MAG: hypothetical protein O3B72_07800, partial [Proteobacteria bacterium]|nr:hypothetical protein [Pseudomonadota bacterium]